MTKTSMGSLSVLMASVMSISAQAKVYQQDGPELDLISEHEIMLSLESKQSCDNETL